MATAHPTSTQHPEGETAQLERWLAQFVARHGAALPRPPSAALEVLRLARRDDARVEELAEVMERDPQLTARVLKLVNSSFYRQPRPVLSVRQAVVVLGLAALEDVVFEAAMHLVVLNAGGLSEALEVVLRHGIAMGWLSRLVARHTALETDSAFVAGLLHDVGLLVGLVALARFLEAGGQAPVLTSARWAVLERHQQRLGADLLRTWGVPEPLVALASRPPLVTLDGRLQATAAVLTLAESLADHAGLGATPRLDLAGLARAHDVALESPDSERLDQALTILTLPPDTMPRLLREADQVLAQLGVSGPPAPRATSEARPSLRGA